MSVDDTVLGLWNALSQRDWDGVKTFLSDDCIYIDMPVGPTLAARGPDDIVKRLKVGLEALAKYENHPGLLVSNGSDVMFEHSESWAWATGEAAELPFVSVHRVVDGRVTLWKDYWDFNAILGSAPSSWMDDFAGADVSWVFDATDHI